MIFQGHDPGADPEMLMTLDVTERIVPLYDEARRQIGTAIVHIDGSFTADITDQRIINQITGGDV